MPDFGNIQARSVFEPNILERKKPLGPVKLVDSVFEGRKTFSWPFISGREFFGLGSHEKTEFTGYGFKNNRDFARHHSAAADRSWFAADSRTILPTQEVTVFLDYELISSSAAAFGINSVTNNYWCGTLLPYSDGKIYWDFGGFAEGTTRLSVAGQTFERAIWVFTTGPRGMEIWKNGIKVASNAANPTRNALNAKWGLGQHGSAVNSGTFYNYGTVLTHGQLSEGAIRMISRDFYGSTLETENDYYGYGPLSAAGVGSLINSGLVNNGLIGRSLIR